jgi:hypothetical protein
MSLCVFAEERILSFKTRFFGTLALVQDKHINMPFQSWEMRPCGPNHVHFTIIAAITEVEMEIKVSTTIHRRYYIMLANNCI